VARFAKKFTNVCDFFALDPSQLYRLAALPDAIVATLTPDTLLTDPRTGKQRVLESIERLRSIVLKSWATPTAAPAGRTSR
jgi:hypothetical protein